MRAWARNALGGMPAEHSLTNCNECGQCEEKCPNSLPIRARLAELRELLAG